MALNRKKNGNDVASANDALNLSYNDRAGALKHLPTRGSLAPQGATTAAPQQIQQGQTIAFFNSDSAPHYVKFGPFSGMTAPTGPANGVPLEAGKLTTLSAGLNAAFCTDNALVFWYIIEDESFIQPSN